MNWWQTPAFTAGRLMVVVLLTIVTITELHQVAR